MIFVAILLSLIMGGVLGLLGGGGSILTVPILVYALDLGAKEAIATSLLVVGVTSLFATIQHARDGNVRWTIALVFGALAMVGAYGGGRLAALVPGPLLLGLFGMLMLATGIAMLRKKTDAEPARARQAGYGKLAIEGLFVGAVTGLVGAGGGFLVVPALVFFAGLGIRAAIGTSLLIISLKSFAGLAGHLNHVSLDPELATVVTASAVVGALCGALISRRVDATSLRRGFAVFVLGMAAFMLYMQLPSSVAETVFVTRWPFWAGGIAIGLFVLVMLRVTGKPLGVSTGYEDACGAITSPTLRRSWRLPFIVGIVAGGTLAASLAGGVTLTATMGMFDELVTASLPAKAAIFTGGGVLLGFGARLAGGCTSGHGIVGMSLLARSSIVATAAFMVSGFVVTHLVLRVIAG